jgi:hypothetical protein
MSREAQTRQVVQLSTNLFYINGLPTHLTFVQQRSAEVGSPPGFFRGGKLEPAI